MTDKDCVCGRCKYHEVHKKISQGKKEVEAWYCNNTRSEYYMDYTMYSDTCDDYEARERIKDIPAVEPKQAWIPCEERLPEDIRPVLVTWKNNDPKSYYQYIVGKHFIGTAHYHRGKWYWYSSVTEDLLAEYGKCDTEEFDEAIEAVAWMPLPEPWKGADE